MNTAHNTTFGMISQREAQKARGDEMLQFKQIIQILNLNLH
jgi:hypothetical protein